MAREIFIITLLITFNGFLSMAEIAYISVRRSSLATDNTSNAKIAFKLSENPDKFLSTIQIGITLIGILTGLYSGRVLAGGFSEILANAGVWQNYSYIIAQAIIVVAVTYFTIIFGELVPKKIGMNNAEKIAKITAKPMYLIYILTLPLVWILAKSTHIVFKIFRLKADSGKVTEEEIKSMIAEGTKDGEVQEVEQDIVERVFFLGDLQVSSLMTHRSDVIAIDINMSNNEIKQLVQENLYEVYPVIENSFDNVKGVITLKDLVFKLDDNSFYITNNIKPAKFFHENASVYNVLEQMKVDKISQALICDEFGSCIGIITLKDILEGLVGNIEDTHSEPDIIKRIDGDGWLIDGQCSFYDFLTFFEKEELFSNTDYNTVGGLLLEELKHIPNTGEFMTWNGFKFEVVDMDGVRIDKILVTYNPDEQQ